MDDRVVEQLEEPPSGFVISITKKGKFRRLHSSRFPGCDYGAEGGHEKWGGLMPEEADIDALCKK